MPTITFLPENITVTAHEGMTILEAAEQNGYPLAFSCRMGRCITDLLTIVEGMENLASPDPEEENTLSIMGEANTRLACVARILKGHVTVRLHVCEE